MSKTLRLENRNIIFNAGTTGAMDKIVDFRTLLKPLDDEMFDEVIIEVDAEEYDNLIPNSETREAIRLIYHMVSNLITWPLCQYDADFVARREEEEPREKGQYAIFYYNGVFVPIVKSLAMLAFEDLTNNIESRTEFVAILKEFAQPVADFLAEVVVKENCGKDYTSENFTETIEKILGESETLVNKELILPVTETLFTTLEFGDQVNFYDVYSNTLRNCKKYYDTCSSVIATATPSVLINYNSGKLDKLVKILEQAYPEIWMLIQDELREQLY